MFFAKHEEKIPFMDLSHETVKGILRHPAGGSKASDKILTFKEFRLEF